MDTIEVETVFKLNSLTNAIEIAQLDKNGNISTKQINPDNFFDMMNNMEERFRIKNNRYKKLRLLENEVIAENNSYCLVKQKGEKRVVTLSIDGNFDYFKINFPNSLYLIKHKNREKIIEIKCFAYKEYKGEETELFEYPMPNELTHNSMCMGNASRTIENGEIIKALNRIIYCPYSHKNFSGLYGFSDSKSYFEYLEKNDFPYKNLVALNMKLKDIL